jgi:hypothetical protein
MFIRVASAVCVIGLAAAVAGAQEVPPALATLAAKAQLQGSVSAWCRAEFRTGHPGAFAVAVASAEGGGRYVAIDADGRLTELGSYKRTADLACYSRAEAQKLDAGIRQSETIAGQIKPRWSTTVVCGFVEDTAAECWQYSPADRTFVKVGQWIT